MNSNALEYLDAQVFRRASKSTIHALRQVSGSSLSQSRETSGPSNTEAKARSSRFSEQTCSFISKYFWFSFFMTMSTSIYRVYNTHWRGSSILYFLAKALLSTSTLETLERYNIVAPGTEYAAEGEPIPGVPGERMEGIDWAFGLHAAFGMLWMFVGYIQICHAHKFHHQKMHTYFGYFATFCFALHILGSLNIVYVDVGRHTALPKILLVCGALSPLAKFSAGVAVAIRKQEGWLRVHKNCMALAYISSLSGSGTIRTIAHLQAWTRTGPISTQNLHGGVATFCQSEYSNRLMLVALLGTLFSTMYVQQCKDPLLSESNRKSLHTMIVQTVVVIAVSHIPGWEAMIHTTFGAPRSTHCHVMLFIGSSFAAAMFWTEFKSVVYGNSHKV